MTDGGEPAADKRSAGAPEDGAPSCICLRFRKAARRVSQIYDQHLAPYGLTITQYGLLGHLHRFDGIGIGALAEKLIMDPTTLTRNLRPLERRGLIEMAADANDRRSRCPRLTAAGRAAFADAKPGWNDAQHEVQEALRAAGASGLVTLLDRSLAQLAV